MGIIMNKSEIEEMIDLVISDPDLKKKFSNLIVTIMEEDTEFKARLADLFAKEAKRKSNYF
jgi:hypothetical protein